MNFNPSANSHELLLHITAKIKVQTFSRRALAGKGEPLGRGSIREAGFKKMRCTELTELGLISYINMCAGTNLYKSLLF